MSRRDVAALLLARWLAEALTWPRLERSEDYERLCELPDWRN